jgi:hypothetical protein
MNSMHVTNGGDLGVVTTGGATLTVTGSTFGANTGGAAAVYDGTATISSTTFMPSRASASGSLDEIRVVAATASAMLTLGDANDIVLLGTTCAMDTCSVLMASGAGANAIVRPNCLQSGTGEIQALAQNGGTISAPPNWTIRTVSGVLLTPGVFPTLPMLPPLPTPPAGGLGGVGF